MNFDWMSSIIGFFLGTITGAAGKYFADQFTDRRRQYESSEQRTREFLSLKKQMPELITEIKTDLSKQDHRLTREFFVLEDRKVHLGGSEKPRLVYYEEDHKDLRCKIDLLENQGFLVDVTIGNAPIYRMSEELVELINKYG